MCASRCVWRALLLGLLQLLVHPCSVNIYGLMLSAVPNSATVPLCHAAECAARLLLSLFFFFCWFLIFIFWNQRVRRSFNCKSCQKASPYLVVHLYVGSEYTISWSTNKDEKISAASFILHWRSPFNTSTFCLCALDVSSETLKKMSPNKLQLLKNVLNFHSCLQTQTSSLFVAAVDFFFSLFFAAAADEDPHWLYV